MFLKYKPDIMFVELIKKMLVYAPSKRISAYDAMLHPFFDDLKDDSFS